MRFVLLVAATVVATPALADKLSLDCLTWLTVKPPNTPVPHSELRRFGLALDGNVVQMVTNASARPIRASITANSITFDDELLVTAADSLGTQFQFRVGMKTFVNRLTGSFKSEGAWVSNGFRFDVEEVGNCELAKAF